MRRYTPPYYQRGGARYDAGGARFRDEEAERRRAADAREAVEKREQEAAFRKKANPIPSIESISQLDELVKAKKPSAPAFVLHAGLMDEGALTTIFPGGPNLVSMRREPPRNLGPHFDDYRFLGFPWTLHVNGGSLGTLKATFLTPRERNSYDRQLESGNLTENQLIATRREIGRVALAGRRPVFMDTLRPGQTTLLWHGSTQPGFAPPGVHDMERTSLITLGDRKQEDGCVIYAHNQNPDAQTPVGFVRTR